MIKTQEIPLWENFPLKLEEGIERSIEKSDFILNKLSQPRIIAYFPEKPNGTSVIICPGGGYGILSTTKEGHDVAREMATWGVTSFVLYYRLPEGKILSPPAPLQDTWRAIRLIKEKIKLWNLKADKLGIMGYSAGGHLALTAATKVDPAKKGSTGLEQFDTSLAFMILGYPVVSFSEPWSHLGSAQNMLGIEASQALKVEYSGEKNITSATPPSFIFHAEDDKSVPVQNSLELVKQLNSHHCQAELHLHPTGGHGFGMGPRAGFPTAIDWMPLLEKWFKAKIF